VEPPAHLDGRQDLGKEERDREADEAERAAALARDPQAEAVRLPGAQLSGEKLRGLLAREAATVRELPDLAHGEDRGERVQVAGLHAAELEPRGAQVTGR
jgi:hypothetical protein